METIKSFTDLEQSRKLAEILPIESADMHYSKWDNNEEEEYHLKCGKLPILDFKYAKNIPAWSLAVLINVLPADWWDCNKHCFFEIYKQQDESSILYIVRYFYYKEEDFNSKNPDFSRITHISTIGDNLIDACVRMIIELHKHKLLSIK